MRYDDVTQALIDTIVGKLCTTPESAASLRHTFDTVRLSGELDGMNKMHEAAKVVVRTTLQ